jgi:hypothetical protein
MLLEIVHIYILLKIVGIHDFQLSSVEHAFLRFLSPDLTPDDSGVYSPTSTSIPSFFAGRAVITIYQRCLWRQGGARFFQKPSRRGRDFYNAFVAAAVFLRRDFTK